MTHDSPSPRSEARKTNEARQAAADALRVALVEYMRAAGEEPEALTNAVEFLGSEVQRLRGE